MAETGRTQYTVEQTANMSTAPAKSAFESLLTSVAAAGNSVLSALTGLLAAFLILYSGYVLYDTFYTQNQAITSSVDLLQYKPENLNEIGGLTPQSGQESFSAINQDYRAWLTIYDSRIDYPVLQGYDDVYYAVHDAFGNSSITGAIYMASASSPDFSDNYNIVYGHHMDNGAMFGGLDSFKEADYFNSHREGLLVTNTGVYDLKIFAAIATDAYEPLIYTFGNRDLAEVLTYIEANAIQADMSAAEGATRIIGLSTCASSDGTSRLVVFATMTPRTLRIAANGYTGVYDGTDHTLQVSSNYPDGTSYRYSTDGGLTWSETKPVIRNAGETQVLIEASNSLYGTATTSVTLKVTPAPLLITVNNAGKTVGYPDPIFTAQATGLIPSDGIVSILPYLTIIRIGGNEAVGVYRGVLIAGMNAAWLASPYANNYAVTFVPGTFTITAKQVLQLNASGYQGVYDGQPHPVTVQMNQLPAGTTVQYSTDGGVTWTNEVPSITNVGVISVQVRATHAGYDPVTVNVVLRVTPAQVTVKADSITKVVGMDDPTLTATVNGVVDGFQIEYSVARKGDSEEPGSYTDEIVPSGETVQGNYIVTFIPGNLIITIPVTAEIKEPSDPMAIFRPAGSRFGDRAWALVNLICLIITVYIFLPLLHLKDKFGRAKQMKKTNEAKCALRTAEPLTPYEEKEKALIEKTALESRSVKSAEALSEKEFASAVEKLYYNVKKFVQRFRIGLLLELLLSLGAIIAFILTEDMRLPMILIDKWTPLMVLFLAACWGTDFWLIRYRDKLEAEEELKEEEEKEPAAE